MESIFSSDWWPGLRRCRRQCEAEYCVWRLPILRQWNVSSSSFVALRTGCKARWHSLVQILTMLRAMPTTSRMRGPGSRKPFMRQLSALVRPSCPLKRVTLVWRRRTWSSHGHTMRLESFRNCLPKPSGPGGRCGRRRWRQRP